MYKTANFRYDQNFLDHARNYLKIDLCLCAFELVLSM